MEVTKRIFGTAHPAQLAVELQLSHPFDNALDSYSVATANLRAEATRHGIDSARLVFAPAMPPDEHLTRHRCADLFLDTLPYNAHTTAIDALWSGLPALTCMGTTFRGRVAASVLFAMGLQG